MKALKKAWRAVLDFWRKFDRAEEVTERPFMIPQSKLTTKIVDLAYEEGIRRLESQVAALARTKQLVQTILGWYVAAGISLVGILVGQIASGGSGFTIIMATYGTVVVAVSAWRFWNGSLFDTVTYEPGVEPAEFLNDEAVDWLNTLPDESWEFYKKHQELVRNPESHRQEHGAVCQNTEALPQRRESHGVRAVRCRHPHSVPCLGSSLTGCGLFSSREPVGSGGGAELSG